MLICESAFFTQTSDFFPFLGLLGVSQALTCLCLAPVLHFARHSHQIPLTTLPRSIVRRGTLANFSDPNSIRNIHRWSVSFFRRSRIYSFSRCASEHFQLPNSRAVPRAEPLESSFLVLASQGGSPSTTPVANLSADRISLRVPGNLVQTAHRAVRLQVPVVPTINSRVRTLGFDFGSHNRIRCHRPHRMHSQDRHQSRPRRTMQTAGKSTGLKRLLSFF